MVLFSIFTWVVTIDLLNKVIMIILCLWGRGLLLFPFTSINSLQSHCHIILNHGAPYMIDMHKNTVIEYTNSRIKKIILSSSNLDLKSRIVAS